MGSVSVPEASFAADAANDPGSTSPRIMHDYSEGDRVAIVLDGGEQRGMPHRRFQGRTGFIQRRQGAAWIVAVKDGNMQKTVIARPEHLRPLE